MPRAAWAWAERQEDVLSRSQLVGFGVPDSQIARLVRQEVLQRIDRSVYLIGVREPTWDQLAWAAVLLAGPGGRLIGRSAGAAEGLCTPTLPIRLGVPLSSGVQPRDWLIVLRESPGVRSPARIGAPPRTPVEDTVLDMCAEATTEGEVVDVLTKASQRLTTHRRLQAALGRRQRIPHRRLITSVLAEVADGVRSPLEHRWIRDVERPHALPVPRRQFRLPSGQLADGAYEEFKVLLELDGRQFHDGARRFRDWRRDNLTSEDGWLTLRYGWHDTVAESCAAAENLGRVLRRRGWTGQLIRCPRCPWLGPRSRPGELGPNQ